MVGSNWRHTELAQHLAGTADFARTFVDASPLPRPTAYGAVMPLTWEQTVVDARDPRALGAWWARALGWVTTIDTNDEVEIRRDADVVPGPMAQQTSKNGDVYNVWPLAIPDNYPVPSSAAAKAQLIQGGYHLAAVLKAIWP